MRRALFVVIINIVFVITDLWPAAATQPLRTIDLMSPESVLRWINGYRQKPDPSSVPDVVKALSRMSAFKDPESAGPYVGFIAGVIAANPERAEELIAKMFPLPEENHWVVVRAIAYSAHPEWRHLLRVFAPRMPARGVMITNYLSQPVADPVPGRGPRAPTTGRKVRYYFSYDTYFGDGKKKGPREELEPSPELLDTFWGYYFASGRYRPISRIVAMLRLRERQQQCRAAHARQHGEIHAREQRGARHEASDDAPARSGAATQPKPIATQLKDVIDAAETVETSRLRKEAMASIEELRRKGPHPGATFRGGARSASARFRLAASAPPPPARCELGLPCVVGGAVSSAGLRYWE